MFALPGRHLCRLPAIRHRFVWNRLWRRIQRLGSVRCNRPNQSVALGCGAACYSWIRLSLSCHSWSPINLSHMCVNMHLLRLTRTDLVRRSSPIRPPSPFDRPGRNPFYLERYRFSQWLRYWFIVMCATILQWQTRYDLSLLLFYAYSDRFWPFQFETTLAAIHFDCFFLFNHKHWLVS